MKKHYTNVLLLTVLLPKCYSAAMSTNLSFKADVDLQNKIRIAAEKLNVPISTVIKAAIKQFLASERRNQLSALDALDELDLTPEMVAYNLERSARFIRQMIVK